MPTASAAGLSGAEAGPPTRPAVVHLKRALELDPDLALARVSLAEAYSVRATLYGADGDWADAALVEASRAVALAPELPDAHRALGFALATNGRFGDAEAAYRRALEMSPMDEEITRRLVEILIFRGRWPEALTALATIRSGTAGFHCELGQLLFGLGYPNEARARFEAALETEPFEVCANVHLALDDLAGGGLESARRRAERIAEVHLGCCDQLLGEVAYRQGRFDDAAAFFSRAIEQVAEPKSTFIHVRLARLEGDPDALRPLAITLERELTSGVDIWFPAWLLALVRAEQGDAAGALHWHEQATLRGHLDWRSDLAEPAFEPLRGTPGFERAIARMQSRIADMRAEIERRGLLEKVQVRESRSAPRGWR